MNRQDWYQARLLILGCCSLSIFFTLGFKLLAKPSVNKFPTNQILTEWESITTNKIKYYGDRVEGKRQTSKNLANHLVVEVYYLPNSNGNNQELIQQYWELKSLPKIKMIENKNFGAYGLFVRDRKTILNTCINPQGKTAFTFEQFTHLSNQNMRQRLLPWFLGLSDLRDWRCYWVNMSVSGDRLTEAEAASILQKQLLTLISQVTQS